MKRKLLGSLEQKIMNILWEENRPFKPAEVLDRLDSKYAYTTVMTVLTRMSEKKILKRKLVGKAYVYSPVITKENFAQESLGNLFNSLVDDYGELAISQFLDTIKDDEDNLKLLEEYLQK